MSYGQNPKGACIDGRARRWLKMPVLTISFVNGGFETPLQGGPLFAAFNVPAGSSLITGWNVVQGNVDLTNTCCYGP
jgi:hypothetical protein